MVGVVDGFRWALLGTTSFDAGSCALSALVTVTILIAGAFYFRRVEKHFADIV
jgi:lipopolysaccharide transport system permease protein